MKGSIIAFDPCPHCENHDMCSKCELTFRRSGVIANPCEWISVEERLPEGKSPIIVTDGEKVIVAYENWLYRSNSTGKLRCPANYGSGMDVTHWMPLPEAPKGGE